MTPLEDGEENVIGGGDLDVRALQDAGGFMLEVSFVIGSTVR